MPDYTPRIRTAINDAAEAPLVDTTSQLQTIADSTKIGDDLVQKPSFLKKAGAWTKANAQAIGAAFDVASGFLP